MSEAPRRYCPLSFMHPPHDACDGTSFDAIAEIEKLETELAAKDKELAECRKALREIADAGATWSRVRILQIANAALKEKSPSNTGAYGTTSWGD